MRSHPLPCVLALAAALSGQDPAAPAPAPPRADGPSGSLGIDFTTAYFFRGIQQENQGVIGQPWIELNYNLLAGGESLRQLDLTLGQWNSLHEGPTGSKVADQSAWYESDFYFGLTGRFDDGIELGLYYTIYHSPNGNFRTVDELSLRLALHDDKLLGEDGPALRPSAVLAVELDGQRDGGNHTGIYLQLGIEPSFPLQPFAGLQPTLSLPVTLGLSLGDYYEDNNGSDDLFGFLDIGVVLSSPVQFMPRNLGPWQAELGLHWLILGSNNENRNQGDSYELILALGFSTTF